MAESPHARLYRGLPPVRPHWRDPRALIGSAAFAGFGLLVIAGFTVGIAQTLTYVPMTRQGNPGVSSWDVWWPPLDRVGLLLVGGAFVVGGVLGFALARGWWRMLVIDAVGLAIVFGPPQGTVQAAEKDIYAWFLWVFGVSAGVGVRRLIRRRRVLRASFLSQPG